jgi:hypothetical protein
MKVLERGIDGWIDAGGETVSTPRKTEAVLYQAPSGEINLRKWVKPDDRGGGHELQFRFGHRQCATVPEVYFV